MVSAAAAAAGFLRSLMADVEGPGSERTGCVLPGPEADAFLASDRRFV